MKKIKVKSQKGFAASDALIAVLIIALFTGIIATISYNIYLANSSIKRTSKATGYFVDMFEYIDKSNYDDVTLENLTTYFNKKYYYDENSNNPKKDADAKIQEGNEEINTPYKVQLIVQKYNETENNQNKLDLVKEITMTVTFKIGNKEQTIEMKKIKSRENLITPNKPELDLLNSQDNEKYYPIKKDNNTWKVCNSSDTEWYNYESGNWALVIKTSRELSLDEEININDLAEGEDIYAWIPRYAYGIANSEILFLFSNSNQYIEKNAEGYNELSEISKNSYSVPSDFTYNDEELTGIWTNDTTLTSYGILNNKYPLNLQ